jgi:hypothetical protein
VNNNSDIQVITAVDNGGVKLQTEVSEKTRNYLRVESVRRRITMGQLIDELVKLLCGNVSETTS